MAELYSNETGSGSDQTQPLDIISLAIDGAAASDTERANLRRLYQTGGFGGEEFECQNSDEANALIQRKLEELRDA